MRRETLLLFALFCAALFMMAGCGGGGSSAPTTANSTQTTSFTLTKEKSTTFTPNSTHRTGVFCRLFYHPARAKFYLAYSGYKTGTTGTSASDQEYAYMELDADLNATGTKGVFATGSGDYAMAFDGTYFYDLRGTPGGYKLTKFDSDFNAAGNVTISFDGTQDAGNDQLMNYTGGKLIIGALYDTAGVTENYMTGTHIGTTYPHLFFYTTSLAESESARYLMDETNIPSGGSIIYNDGKYHLVTADQMGQSKLYAYQWDANWKYIGKTLLAPDGQWSQGLLYDSGRYYVAFHTGAHGNGNVALGVYDSSWNAVTSAFITTYSNDYTAQRPWLIKVNSKVYVSYDVATAGDQLKDWQCHVDTYATSE